MPHDAYMAAITRKMPLFLTIFFIGKFVYSVLFGAFVVMVVLFVVLVPLVMGLNMLLGACANKRETQRIARRLNRHASPK